MLSSAFTTIWRSFQSLPLWVRVWVALILVPVNALGLFFLDQPIGWILSLLGIGGMLPNLIIIWLDRGFSKRMALPHLIPWSILVGWIIWTLGTASPTGALLWVLITTLCVDILSLAFDFSDAFRWLNGDRKVSRPA